MVRSFIYKLIAILLAVIWLNQAGATILSSEGDIPLDPYRVNLISGFKDALRNDPTFQQQVAEYLRSKEATPQALAVLLPQISLTSQTGAARIHSTQTGKREFSNDSFAANLNQVIFNANAIEQLQQAKASVRAAAIQLSADLQALIIRYSSAYFAVLQAQDLLRYTQQQRVFLRKTLYVTKERYKLHHATITDVDFSLGAYRAIEADWIQAKINLFNTIQDLSEITGIRYKKFATFGSHIPRIAPAPFRLQAWINQARLYNLDLNASRMSLVAAKLAIRAAQGNFLPTISAVADYSNVSGSLAGAAFNSQLKQITGTSEYDARADWPIFQGGATLSEVRENIAQYRQAWGLMRQRYLNAIATTRIAFIGIRSGLQQTTKSELSVNAYQQAVNHGDEAYRGGVLSIFDVLQSQTRLFNEEQKFVRSFYSYIQNTLLLKQAGGTLAPESLESLNRWLVKRSSSHTLNKRSNHTVKTVRLPKPIPTTV